MILEGIKKQLEYPRLEINNPHILYDPVQACYKFQMRWILFKAIAAC